MAYHIQRPVLPLNAHYYPPELDEEGVLSGFSLDWLRSLSILTGIDSREIMLAMSDGSVSADAFGGCGYFASLLSFMQELNVDAIRSRKFRRRNAEEFNWYPPNGVSNYISLAAAVARRASIKLCELHGVEYMLLSLVKFVEKVFVKVKSGDANWGIKVISVSLDSKSVLAWIGGASVTYNAEE